MLLSKNTLNEIPAELQPDSAIFNLPEKVLQFGTGVLLRGLPDYFIDKANRKGIFNGRIVVVKSTDHGSTADFDEQDSLYTLNIKGYEHGNMVDRSIICSAISRVLTAGKQWNEILACAESPDMQIIISNTTETGIQFLEEESDIAVPVSYPGKLLAFLRQRYQAFNGSKSAGMVIVPTELIGNNGDLLKDIVVRLARYQNSDESFVRWIDECNLFCNSLVDRIVPGKPDEETRKALEKKSGYQDNLSIIAEPYRLWAIQAPEETKKILSFCKADEQVIIKPDIEQYRELKLRLLNGTHTFCCGIAYLSGFSTVREAMDDPAFYSFIKNLLQKEITPAIPYQIDEQEKQSFGAHVLDRFKNPTIAHAWLSISLHYSSKMKMRNVPLIVNYYQLFNQVPVQFAKGFAAYLLFSKPVKQEGSTYFGESNGVSYPLQDDQAAYYAHLWENSASIPEFVTAVLENVDLWGYNLNSLKGFGNAVSENLINMMNQGVRNILNN
jgi:tagaturonate reductase